jgi:hypothetical protein
MNFGAFAGGMAGGLSQGMQLKNMQQRTDMAGKEADMKAEEHGWKKEDRAKMQNFYERMGNEITPVSFRADGGTNNLTAAATPQSFALKPLAERPSFGAAPGGLGGSAMGSAVSGLKGAASGLMGAGKGLLGGAAGLLSKFADGGMVDLDEEFVRNTGPSATQMPDPQAMQQQPAQPAQQQPASAKENMMRAMWDGNAMQDPDKLTQVARIAHEEGVGNLIVPWLEQAYAAKKSGKVNGVMKLLQGDVDGAIDDLAKGGMKLADRPTKVNDDPEDHKWKINIEGSGEQVMDLHQLLATTMDPDKYREHHFSRKDKDREHGLKQNEDARKERETTADVGLKGAQAEYYKGAKTNEAMARAGKYGRDGSGSGTAKEHMDRVLKRQDATIEDLSSEQNESDNKYYVNPKKRQMYSNLVLDTEEELTRRLGRPLKENEHHKITSLLRTAPLGDAAGMEQWGTQVYRTFGVPAQGQQTAQTPPAGTQPPPGSLAATAQPAAAQPPAPPPGAPRLGGLAALQQEQALRDKMNGIQAALQNPNLSPEQKQQLAMQAQQIATMTDAYYKGR